jgi:hypothetical protein
MIGVHPEMFGLPETNLFARDTYGKMAPFYKIRPPFQHGLLRAYAELGFGEQNDENINVVKAWLEGQKQTPTRNLFEDLGSLAAPRELVEKSPLHVYSRESLDNIAQSFPEARFLHLTRHPRGTCESIYAMRQDTLEKVNRFRSKVGGKQGSFEGPMTSKLEMTPERMWFDPHVNILEFLEEVPEEQQMRLRGEDLLSDPDVYLAEIARWLGISDSPDAIAAMKHPEMSAFAKLGPQGARYGNDPSFLEAPELRPYKRKKENFVEPLSWDPKLVFSEAVIELADLLGYES